MIIWQPAQRGAGDATPAGGTADLVAAPADAEADIPNYPVNNVSDFAAHLTNSIDVEQPIRCPFLLFSFPFHCLVSPPLSSFLLSMCYCFSFYTIPLFPLYYPHRPPFSYGWRAPSLASE